MDRKIIAIICVGLFLLVGSIAVYDDVSVDEKDIDNPYIDDNPLHHPRGGLVGEIVSGLPEDYWRGHSLNNLGGENGLG